SPKARELVPTYKGTAGFPAGVGVEAKWENSERPYQEAEKIAKLREYLEANRKLYAPLSQEDRAVTSPPFRIEVCQAVRLHIPPKPKAPRRFKGITLWVADPRLDSAEAPAKTCTLCLLEDQPRGDDEVLGGGVSVFTALEAVLADMGKELQQTV